MLSETSNVYSFSASWLIFYVKAILYAHVFSEMNKFYQSVFFFLFPRSRATLVLHSYGTEGWL